MFRSKTVQKPKTIGNIGTRHYEDDEEPGKEVEKAAEKAQSSWFSRAAEKISSAASKVTAKTASLLDFNTGAADVIFVRHRMQVINVGFKFLCGLLFLSGVVFTQLSPIKT
jgi:hypothetical protein